MPTRATYDIINTVEKLRPCGQAVKTEPSQGSIPGSIPGKVTTKRTAHAVRFFVVTLPDVLLRAVRASAACCRALRRVPFGKPQIPGKTSAVRFFVVTLPDVLLRAVRASAACCRALRRVPFGKPQIPGKTSAVRFFVVTLPDVLLRAATRSQFMKKPQARQFAAPAGIYNILH